MLEDLFVSRPFCCLLAAKYKKLKTKQGARWDLNVKKQLSCSAKSTNINSELTVLLQLSKKRRGGCL